MLRKYRTAAEVYASASDLPEEVFTELLRGAVVLDSEYGEDRDCNSSGGFSLVAETAEDLQQVKTILNYDTYPCEWVTRLGNSGYLSALYILNNDFSIMLFLPEAIAPYMLLKEIEN